jgi:SPP1 family predicted phage head-tail adaptor
MPIQTLLSGMFNRRITILSPSTSQDAVGQPIQTYTWLYSCWASIDVQNSQLQYETAEFISKTTHRITFRWTSSVVIEPNMRIVYSEGSTDVTHTYTIETVLNQAQANKTIMCLAYEVDSGE